MLLQRFVWRILYMTWQSPAIHRHFIDSYACDAHGPPRPQSSRPISPLFRTLTLELLLRLRRLRVSAGSAGLKPLARAYRLSTSVKLTTPTKRPESRAPGREDAGIEGAITCGTPEGEVPARVGAAA